MQGISQIDDLKSKAIEQLQNAPSPDSAKRKNTYSFKDLWVMKDIVQKFLIPELLPSNALATLIGEDGIGKTQILTQLCLSIALQRKQFMGLELNAVHFRCMIVATEDSKEKFSKALAKQALAMEPDLDPEKLQIDFVEASYFDDLKGMTEEIVANLKENPYDLIVCDALSDVFTMIDGEINSNSHARKILGAFQSIINEYNTTVMFVHHASKSSLTEKRKQGKMFVEKSDSQGAGAISQKPRTVWALTHDPSSIKNDGLTYTNYLHVVKANLMSKHYTTHAIELEFDARCLLHSPLGLVDIQQFESEDPENPSSTVRKSMPRDINDGKHFEIVEKAFNGNDVLKRSDLVMKLKELYGVGKNKIEEKTGYLNHLIDVGLIVNQLGYYRKSGVSPVTMPSTENWELPPASEITNDQDDEVPF